MVIFVNVFFFYGESKRNEKEPTVWIIWARGVGIKLTFFFFWCEKPYFFFFF
jgi:hypothetical protein